MGEYEYEYDVELVGSETPDEAAYRAMQWALETKRMWESEYGREMTLDWLAPCGRSMVCWSWVSWVNLVSKSLLDGKPVRVTATADFDCGACSVYAEWQ